MTICIRRKNVYGNNLIYAVTHGDALARLTGTATLSQRHLSALKDLGVVVRDLDAEMEIALHTGGVR